MNEENEVYEAEVEETVGEEEEYEDECVGYGATVAALAVGALGGILINRIYHQVKPRLRKAKERWANHKALKAASEDDYDEVEDDDEPDKAPKKK